MMIISLFLTMLPGVSGLFGFYEIPEGYRGTVKTFGKLHPDINNPGLNWCLPYNTVELYDVRWQTDKLSRVECGSNKGGTVYLDIEVVNRLKDTPECVYKMAKQHGVDYDSKLIFDYIPSEVGQFCKNYSVEDIYVEQFDKLDEVLASALRHNIEAYNMDVCLEIKPNGVRIGRPRLTNVMRDKFELIESEQKDKDLAQQQLETERVREQLATQKAVMTQERSHLVAQKTAETRILEQKSAAEIQTIKDSSLASQIKSKASAEADARKLMAEADKLWLTPARIEYEKSLAIAQNSKLIFNSPEKAFIGLGNDYPNKELHVSSGVFKTTECTAA
jgi:regulator of protease activity HflC (stomatin/prohibitin superfamily)